MVLAAAAAAVTGSSSWADAEVCEEWAVERSAEVVNGVFWLGFSVVGV